MAEQRKIVVLTGTRADFGKLKTLLLRLEADPQINLHVFVTGMHMLSRYGYTCEEVEKLGFANIYRFINQNAADSMDHILSKTIAGLADYIREIQPDLLLIHGDRVEALAGATVGSLNNVLTAHVEGGEVSGTVDELIRHAVTKLSHAHFVANEEARNRLIQLGEVDDTVFVIGSPDIDVMNSNNLPSLDEVRSRYDLVFDRYGILMFHPVTTEVGDLRRQISTVVDQLIASDRNFVVIYPNNDHGTELILDEYQRLTGHPRFRIYPSMRFEYFLSLLKHADFMIGNSSAGVREAPHFGVPAINLGSRQTNRVYCETVRDVQIERDAIQAALQGVDDMSRQVVSLFGEGDSATRFHRIVSQDSFWRMPSQKYFVDRPLAPPAK
jgi:UDP-N-acetylglucosamine 2-epimerase (hydrolysing)